MTTFSADTVRAARDELVRRDGPWTAHCIQLADDVFTIEGPNYFAARTEGFIRWVSYFVSKPPGQLRMLDLACLEGGFAIEMARRGVSVVGIEARRQHLEKAVFAATVNGLTNVTFVQDDVRNLSPEKYGRFDITFCNGILYHLDAPDVFEFAARVSEVTTNVAVFDTHISAAPDRRESWRGKMYEGHTFGEHDERETTEARLAKLWASLDNARSFWPTLPSLVQLLHEVGFADTFEADPLAVDPTRVQLLAVKPGLQNRELVTGT